MHIKFIQVRGKLAQTCENLLQHLTSFILFFVSYDFTSFDARHSTVKKPVTETLMKLSSIFSRCRVEREKERLNSQLNHPPSQQRYTRLS